MPLEIGMLLTVIFAYLVGSLPFGFLVGKIVYKKDLREFGSGNIGATNAYRVLGPSMGVGVFILDFVKGALPVFLAGIFFKENSFLIKNSALVLSGTASLIGHDYSIYLKFGGGKGVATALGVTAILAPVVLPILALVWIIFLITFRYVSLASITIAFLFPFLMVFLYRENLPYLIFSIVVSSIIIFKHTSNIKRILAGREPKVGQGE